MPDEGLEVGVMVEQGEVVSQHYSANHTVDQSPNGIPFGSTPSVQQCRGLVVRAHHGEHGGSTNESPKILQV